MTEHDAIYPIWKCSCGETNSTINDFCSKCSRSQFISNYIDPCAGCNICKGINEFPKHGSFDFLVRDLVRY